MIWIRNYGTWPYVLNLIAFGIALTFVIVSFILPGSFEKKLFHIEKEDFSDKRFGEFQFERTYWRENPATQLAPDPLGRTLKHENSKKEI